jgi:hypothetical protein
MTVSKSGTTKEPATKAPATVPATKAPKAPAKPKGTWGGAGRGQGAKPKPENIISITPEEAEELRAELGVPSKKKLKSKELIQEGMEFYHRAFHQSGMVKVAMLEKALNWAKVLLPYEEATLSSQEQKITVEQGPAKMTSAALQAIMDHARTTSESKIITITSAENIESGDKGADVRPN